VKSTTDGSKQSNGITAGVSAGRAFGSVGVEVADKTKVRPWFVRHLLGYSASTTSALSAVED
jgi:hypothetical protein